MSINEKQTINLNESPSISSQDELAAFEDNQFRRKMVKRLLKHKSKWKFETIGRNDEGRERDIYSVSLDGYTEYFSLLFDETELGYYVKMVHVDNTHAKIIPKSQALVWQNVTVRVAEDMFLNYYLPKFKALATDQYQIPRVKRFWAALVYRALRKGYSVYFVNKGGIANTVKITDGDNFEGFLHAITGHELNYKHHIILITTTEIPELETFTLLDENLGISHTLQQ